MLLGIFSCLAALSARKSFGQLVRQCGLQAIIHMVRKCADNSSSLCESSSPAPHSPFARTDYRLHTSITGQHSVDRNAARHLVMSTLRVIERSSTRGDRSEDRVEGDCADRKGKIADEMQFPGLPHRGYNAQDRTVRSTWLSASSTAAQNLQCFHVAPSKCSGKFSRPCSLNLVVAIKYVGSSRAAGRNGCHAACVCWGGEADTLGHP